MTVDTKRWGIVILCFYLNCSVFIDYLIVTIRLYSWSQKSVRLSYLPEDQNQLSPLFNSSSHWSRLSPSSRVTWRHGWIMIWAILSHLCTRYGSCQRLIRTTHIFPVYVQSTTHARTSIPCLYASHERGAILPYVHSGSWTEISVLNSFLSRGCSSYISVEKRSDHASDWLTWKGFFQWVDSFV